MPHRKTPAVILRLHPFGESDRLVTLLTRTYGKVRAIAKGARRSQKRFLGCLDHLNIVLVRYFEKRSGGLVRLEP